VGTGWDCGPGIPGEGLTSRKCKVTGERYDGKGPLPAEDRVGELVLAKRPDFATELSELGKVRCPRHHL
jgi:hypothetical protein